VKGLIVSGEAGLTDYGLTPDGRHQAMNVRDRFFAGIALNRCDGRPDTPLPGPSSIILCCKSKIYAAYTLVR